MFCIFYFLSFIARILLLGRQRNIVTAWPGGTDTATQAEGAVFDNI